MYYIDVQISNGIGQRIFRAYLYTPYPESIEEFRDKVKEHIRSHNGRRIEGDPRWKMTGWMRLAGEPENTTAHSWKYVRTKGMTKIYVCEHCGVKGSCIPHGKNSIVFPHGAPCTGPKVPKWIRKGRHIWNIP